jgi:hypothetical protein
MTRPLKTEVAGLLVRSTGPVCSSYVPTPKGLTVLYGVNGAGKSHLLRSLTAGLTGTPAGRQATTLAVRVGGASDGRQLPAWLNQYLASWADHHEKHWDGGRDLGAIAMTTEPALMARRAVMEALESAGPDDDEEDQFDRVGVTRDDVATEIVDQWLYLLEEPITSGERTVHVGALLGEATPNLNRALPSDHAMRSGPDAFVDPTGGSDSSNLTDLMHDPRPTLTQLYFSASTVQADALADVVVADSDPTSPPELLRIFERIGVPITSDELLSPESRAFEILRGIELHAQELLDLVLMDAPRLRLHRGSMREWFTHEAPDWRVGPAGASLPRRDFDRTLDGLSEAQLRWMSLAINTAATVSIRNQMAATNGPSLRRPPATGGELFILVDEPEAHLHRSGEAHMARGLKSWSEQLDAHIMVASHSPELLDQAGTHLLHVANAPGSTTSRVRRLTAPTLQTMTEFGLHASDLLRRQNGFLLVEGLHDQIVLEELLGDELRASRVEILPIRGAKQLPATVDSQFLFDFTDATVIVMLDAVDMSEVELAWNRAQTLAAEGDISGAGDSLRSSLAGNAPERRWMREFLSKSLERGIHDRLVPFGLEALDVIEYLPPLQLVPGANSWGELRDQHRSSGTKKDFKSWLTSAKRADFSPEAIRSAARSMDRIPNELVTLVNICDGLGRTRSTPTPFP